MKLDMSDHVDQKVMKNGLNKVTFLKNNCPSVYSNSQSLALLQELAFNTNCATLAYTQHCTFI